MKCFYLSLFLSVLLLGACSTNSLTGTTPKPFSDVYVAGYSIPKPISCVPYARDVSGVPIRGDAHTWWAQADGRYVKAQTPKPGAIFVLSKSRRLSYGHLSVVTKVIDPRTIEVTHSNWGSNKRTRSIIYKRMRVEDTSPLNDWTSARFWNKDIKAYGSPYKASGFIYPS